MPSNYQENFDSTEYWRNRYRSGGNSGSGSYGRLAVYKAHEINRIVHRLKVKSVLDLGSGDGANAALYSIRNYTGVDISAEMVLQCQKSFAQRAKWCFCTLDDFQKSSKRFQMTMSLDVIYHLVEDRIFDNYMDTLFSRAKRLVLIYSTDHHEQAPSKHVLHREYSSWIKENRPEWSLVQKLEHPFPRTNTTNPKHTALAFFQLFEHKR